MSDLNGNAMPPSECCCQQNAIISDLITETQELRRGMHRMAQTLMNVREVLASSDLPPRLRVLLNMYQLPKTEMTVERCIGEELRDTHVIVSAYVRDGTLHSSMVALSDLPNDLVSLEDLERAGIILDDSLPSVSR
jgi:hypothetical protein